LTSALDGGEWTALRLGLFTSRKRAPRTNWIGGWAGPGAILDTVVKRKIPSPRRELRPTTLVVQHVGSRYTNRAIVAVIRLGHVVKITLNKARFNGDSILKKVDKIQGILDVFAAVRIHVVVFWVMTPYSDVLEGHAA
jgi:hypothetical protein